jgi:hypothetical protein
MPPTVQAPLVIIIMIIASECNPGVCFCLHMAREEGNGSSLRPFGHAARKEVYRTIPSDSLNVTRVLFVNMNSCAGKHSPWVSWLLCRGGLWRMWEAIHGNLGAFCIHTTREEGNSGSLRPSAFWASNPRGGLQDHPN